MKKNNVNNSDKVRQRQRLSGGRLRAWTLLAMTAGVLAVQTPCEAKIKWKDVLGVVCTVGGVGVGLTGHVEVGVALIGLQGTLLGSSAIIANNPDIPVGPDVTPAGILGTGSTAHSTEAMQAFLVMNCPNVPVAGTPAEQNFIQKANVVITLGRQLRTLTNQPTAAAAVLQQMSVALDQAGNAYEALGLDYAVTQTQWDDFKLDCAADGIAPQLEENYLIACGLTPAQRLALNQDQAAQRSVLDHRIKYKPGTVIHQAAARFNTNNVGFADLLHVPVGGATVSQPATGGVQVQLASTGGASGVKIELPNVLEWNGYWSDLDADDSLPVGAYIESVATGDALGSVTNGPLGSWRMTKLGTTNYQVTADFSVLGAAHVTVMVFNGSNLVATAGGLSGPLCIVNGCVSDDHWGRPTTKPILGGALTLRGPKDVTLSNGARCVGDRIAIVPEGAPLITSFSSVSVSASGVPSLHITDETTPAARMYPGPRWLTLGIPGFAGGCFPGWGICSISPFPFPDGAPVLFSYPGGNSLTLEFTSAQTGATNVFTVAQPITLDDDTARSLNFSKVEIRPGQYAVDYSKNPFGTVQLDIAAETVSLTLDSTGMVNVTWPADGERVLQISDSVTGPWVDAPVQTMRLRESPTLPSRYYVVKSSK